MRRSLFAVLICLLCTSTTASFAQARNAAAAERGVYVTYRLQHAVGSETYSVGAAGPQGLVMTIASTLSDRGSTRASTSTLTMGAGFAPVRLELKRVGAPADEAWRTEVGATSATVQEP